MLLLDFVEVAASHTGVEMANAFAEMLVEFGVQGKVGHCTPNVAI